MKINKAQKYIKGSFDLISSVRKVYYEAISLFLAVGAITETAQNNPDIEIFITFTYLDQTSCGEKLGSNVFEFSSKIIEKGKKRRKRKKFFIHTNELVEREKKKPSRNGNRTRSKNLNFLEQLFRHSKPVIRAVGELRNVCAGNY